MKEFFQKILNMILPPKCLCCGKIIRDENGFCADCFQKINFITAPYCARCGLPFENAPQGKKLLCTDCLKDKNPLFRMCRSAVKYDDFFKKNILAFKFMDKTQNAVVFAKILKLAGKDIFEKGADVLMPVPLHFKRLVTRRYNQSALMAKELARLTGLSVDTFSLVKIKPTKPQIRYSGRARVKNVKDAFSVADVSCVKGKRIVLIDDVMTTGSTLKECAKALHKAGAKSVDCITVARVYR